MKTCGKEGCNPVEQVRGEMKRGDYADVVINHRYTPPWDQSSRVNAETSLDMHELAEMDDSIRNDFRICCLTCGKATPWNKPDAPGMPGIGRVFTRNIWDESVK